MSIESQNLSEVFEKTLVDSNENRFAKVEPFPKKWEEKVDKFPDYSNENGFAKVEPFPQIEEKGVNKFPDITNSVDDSFKSKINDDENKKKDELSKKEVLENESSNTSSKIEKSQGEINILELETNFLEIIEDTLNNIVIFLNDIGIKIEKFDFDKIDVLNKEIDTKKSDLIRLDNQFQNQQNQISKLDSNINILDENISNTKNKQEFFDKNLRIQYDNFDEYAKTKNLTSDDIEAINEAKKELINKLNEADVDKLSQEQFIKEMDKYVISTIEKLNEELDDFDIDIEAVAKNAAISGAIGAGFGTLGGPLGALTGGIIGTVTGIAGEVTYQYAKYKGLSEKEALAMQIGVELLGGVGLAKVSGKIGLNAGKTLLTKVDKIDNIGNSIKDVSNTSKFGNITDTLSTKIKDVNPNINEGKLNLIKGEIAERTQDSYYLNSGWKKIEGEVGRNGIDGLYYKLNKNGTVVDVLLSESKYNTSKLGETLNGKQMSKEWILKKLDNLIEAFPDNKNYQFIKKFVDNDLYRARLWQLKENGDNLQISVSKILQKGHSDIDITKLQGSESLKINNFQNIDLVNPSDKYSQKIADMYNKNVENVLNNSKYMT